MATKKKKTTSGRKKTVTKKKRSAAKKSTTRKKTAKRAPSASASKKKKKAASRKKATSSSRKTTKKKTGKKTAATKKKTKTKTKKKTAKKVSKTTAKKSTVKKKSSGTKSGGAKATSGAEASKKSTQKKKSKKKSTEAKEAPKTVARGKNKRSQSVVEAASGAEADNQGYVFINGRRVRMISTQGKVISRKPKKPSAEQTKQSEPIEVKPGKSKLTKKQLRHYRDLLLIKRAELVGDLTAMEAEALRSSGGNISHMPIHMADIGSDTYEQDFMLGMAETERKQIREIDDALMRIQEGTYGVCQMTGKPIPKARLDAKPWAKYTIEAARKMEGHWQS